jgi:hypothetical protein
MGRLIIDIFDEATFFNSNSMVTWRCRCKRLSSPSVVWYVLAES